MDVKGDKIRLGHGVEQQIPGIAAQPAVRGADAAQLSPDILGRVAAQPDQHLRVERLQNERSFVPAQALHQQGFQPAHAAALVVFDLDQQGHPAVHQLQQLVHGGDARVRPQQAQLLQVLQGPLLQIAGDAGHPLQFVVMKHHQAVIRGDVYVQFDGMSPVHGPLKGRNRILRHAVCMVMQPAVGHQSIILDKIGFFPFCHSSVPPAHGFLPLLFYHSFFRGAMGFAFSGKIVPQP